jgi:hypothetical protein
MMIEIESRLFVSFVDNDEQRLWLRNLLSAGSIGVVFTKKDGTEREMVCTLSAEMIPQDAAPKNSGRTQPTDAIAVFDLEKGEWRSFRFDSIKSVFTP